MRRRAWLTIALLAACGGSPSADQAPPGPTEPDAAAPTPAEPGLDASAGDGGGEPEPGGGAKAFLNQAVQKAIHNAYERDEPLFDQLVYHRARTVELDIHVDRGGQNTTTGDWFVYHEDVPFFRDTTCNRLSDCLGQLAAFHAAVPRHEVVTIFVDLKGKFGPGHTQDDLDAAFVKAFGRTSIFAPKDLVDRCPGAGSLRAAVAGSCHFPSLADLRGKIIVATTGGTGCDAASNVSSYLGSAPLGRLAFGAPDTDASCPMTAYDQIPSFVFFNMSFDNRALAAEVKSRNLLGRIYKGGLPGGLDDPGTFGDARSAGAQFLATDKVNTDQDPWATTSSTTGFPFSCKGCEPPLAEAGALLTVRASGGDAAGTADSLYLAAAESSAAETWSAFVSVPSSHTEPWAKACIVARAANTATAANVAICRPFDQHPPRLQIRATDGGATSATELATLPGLTVDTPAFLRLRLAPTGATTLAVADASADGNVWLEVGRTTVNAPLPLRGLAVAAHGAASARAIYGRLTRSTSAGSQAVALPDLTQRLAVGASAAGAVADGIAP